MQIRKIVSVPLESICNWSSRVHSSDKAYVSLVSGIIPGSLALIKAVSENNDMFIFANLIVLFWSANGEIKYTAEIF